jgi:acetyltransferase-like isoleucine patch superfamily enzyme
MRYRNLPHTTDVIIRRFHFLLGMRNLLGAWWWGVKTGTGLKFSGKCHFKLYPKSTMVIGNNCEFLSRPNANLIGINRPCIISTLAENAVLEIGENCGFSGTVIGTFTKIKLGKNVRCGANTVITDSDWHPEDSRAGVSKPITIGNNVWLGLNAIVLKGVEIGDNTLIGANSVVTSNIPANVIAAGNPCRVLKQL